MVVSTRVSPVTVGLCIMLCLMAATVHSGRSNGMEQRDNGDVKGCSIARFGALTMFNNETAEVKLPCKFRLSDFTCGIYRVKVTPGSAVDREYSHRFSPDTVWVKVVNTKTSEYVKIRTSVKRLDKFNKEKLSNPWQVKNGSVSVVDFANYDQTKAAAVLRKDGVFSVEFSSEERSVVVTCLDDEFDSKGLPEALCGARTTTDAIQSATTALFPGQDGITDDALVNYVVLNHDNVVQSPTCTNLASKFTSCQDKEQAAMECAAIFGDQAECLAGSNTSLSVYFAGCLRYVCDNDTSALQPMNNYITENCGPCPNGYTLYNDSCYRLETFPVNFTEASETCESEGGQLVTIESKAEDDYLTRFVSDDLGGSTTDSVAAWIGLTAGEGEYRWLGSFNPPTFISVLNTIPYEDLDCVATSPDYGWFQQECGTNYPFVCETSARK